MDPSDALEDLTEIRMRMASTQEFTGYRSLIVGSVGGLAVAAAIAQPILVPSPSEQLSAYLTLWVGVATIAFLSVAGGLWWRVRSSGSQMVRDATLLAVDQLLPSLAIGAVTTLGILIGARESAWMLPGLWSLFFSLGVFASYRGLPRPAFWVGVYFAALGAAGLIWGQGAHAFSPWQMGASFGGGNLLGAVILYRSLERRR